MDSFRSLLLLSFLVTSCGLLPTLPSPESPHWTFLPPPHGSYEGRVAVSASAGAQRPVYLSEGGDPRSNGSLHTPPHWLGGRGAWSLNWSTPIETGWDRVRSTTYRVAPDRPQSAAGADHALVIESTTLWAWGHGANGQLGQGPSNTPQMQTEPLVIAHSEAILAVWAAGDNTLFLDEKGDLWFCGYGPWLGETSGYLVRVYTPLRVPLPEGVRAVSASISELGGVWAIDQNGRLWVWGMNGQGSFGIGTDQAEVRNPVQTLSDVALVVAGPYHALTLRKDGSLWAAGLHHGTGDGGMDAYNRLGTDSDTADHPTWTSIGTWDNVLSLGAEEYHSWLLTADGDVWAWGYNGFGQLPLQPSDTPRVDKPTKVAENVAMVGAGTRFTLVAPEEGSLALWGEGPNDMPSLAARDGLRSIHAGTSFVLVLSGGFHEAAADPWAALTTWGSMNQ